MENIRISVTDDNSILVKADSKRFGKDAIMYEDTSFMRCCDYIRRETGNNHFRMSGIPALGMFKDSDGRVMPRFMTIEF